MKASSFGSDSWHFYKMNKVKVHSSMLRCYCILWDILKWRYSKWKKTSCCLNVGSTCTVVIRFKSCERWNGLSLRTGYSVQHHVCHSQNSCAALLSGAQMDQAGVDYLLLISKYIDSHTLKCTSGGHNLPQKSVEQQTCNWLNWSLYLPQVVLVIICSHVWPDIRGGHFWPMWPMWECQSTYEHLH